MTPSCSRFATSRPPSSGRPRLRAGDAGAHAAGEPAPAAGRSTHQQQTEKGLPSRCPAGRPREGLQREQLQVLRERERCVRAGPGGLCTRGLGPWTSGRSGLSAGAGPRAAHPLRFTLWIWALPQLRAALSPRPPPSSPPSPSEGEPISALGQEFLPPEHCVERSRRLPLNPFDEEEDLASPSAEGTASLCSRAFPQPASPRAQRVQPLEEEEEEEAVAGNPFAKPDGPAPTPSEEEDEPPADTRIALSPGNPFKEAPAPTPSRRRATARRAPSPSRRSCCSSRSITSRRTSSMLQCGRLDEVEVLTENLRELRRTLAKQKRAPTDPSRAGACGAAGGLGARAWRGKAEFKLAAG